MELIRSHNVMLVTPESLWWIAQKNTTVWKQQIKVNLDMILNVSLTS